RAPRHHHAQSSFPTRSSSDLERYNRYQIKKNAIDQLHELVSDYTVYPEQMDPMLKQQGTTALSQPVKAKTLIPRPQISIRDLFGADEKLKERAFDITSDKTAFNQVEIQIKYAGYIEKEFEMVKEMQKQEDTPIPDSVNYEHINSLSAEGKQKMDRIRPETLGQASRISGVSPSDISVLMVYLKN